MRRFQPCVANSTTPEAFPFVAPCATMGGKEAKNDKMPNTNQRSVRPDFGEGLRALRRQCGISVVDMAEKTGISRSNLHRLEAGEIAEPSIETLNTLANALDVEPEDLYDLAWTTNATNTGLPSLPTYFRAKYDLDDDQIKAVERALKRVTKTESKS